MNLGTILHVSTHPSWLFLLVLAVHAVIGVILGLLYFTHARHTAARLANDGRLTAILLPTAGRFVLLGLCLTVASLEGAAPLLVTATGILVARTWILRRTQAVAS
ncbi:MAG: ATP synthase subunit I [Acetobacteraceae bacterium]